MNARKIRRSISRRCVWNGKQEIIVAVLTETKFLAALLPLEREDDVMDHIKNKSKDVVYRLIEDAFYNLMTCSERTKHAASEMVLRLFIEVARRNTEIVKGIMLCKDISMLCCSIFELEGGGLEKRIIGLRNVPENIIYDGLRLQMAVAECLRISPVMRSVSLSDYASDSAIHEYLS